jgi:hypothetical protein
VKSNILRLKKIAAQIPQIDQASSILTHELNVCITDIESDHEYELRQAREQASTNHPTKLRPCEVHVNGIVNAYFHKWGQFSDEGGSTVGGVIEFRDGTCDWYPPDVIKFTDRNEVKKND